ncbi:type IV toxin-antitoxin system AbiEi family antitoxin domain-containing protein [Streptomyces flaveolus]|uniref:type IV toxin-antitoxin system AbiEi family antitoxin domain-containing protein n=1 Tax=Streptomyces flaveolus TaxID=67297 RepID=UPI0033E4C738
MDRAEQLATVAGMAADQWGLVTAAQAKGLGVSGVQLMRLTEAGLLESVGHGVYALLAVGLPQHLEIKVAWLRLQPKTPAWDRPLGGQDSGVVSHASACQLHGLGDIPAPDVEISVPRRRTTTEPFVRLRTACLDTADITVVDGLPVTTAARTIVDLLHTKADGGHVGGVIADAERRDLVDIDALADAVQPYARKYGLPAGATGQELIEHLVGQAGRTLHSQEVARAGHEGLALGAEIGALEDTAVLVHYLKARPHVAEGLKHYLNAQVHGAEAVKPLGGAMAAEAFAPLFRDIAGQLGIRTALNEAMPRLFPAHGALSAFQQEESPFARALREVMPSSGIKEALQQAGGLLAMRDVKMPSVLSPEMQRALWGANVSGTAMSQVVRALQQKDAESPANVDPPEGEHASTADDESKKLQDEQAPG